MSSGGGGEDGRGGGTSCEDVDVVCCRFSGMNDGGGMAVGGGGCRGGGGIVIIGGRDLSTTPGATPDGVRERATASSRADDSVDSMDCLRSECDVRGRGMSDGISEAAVSLTAVVAVVVVGTVEGAVMNCCEDVVGPAEGGGEMNWNCCEGGPTRNRVGDEAGAGDGGAVIGGCGGTHSSV